MVLSLCLFPLPALLHSLDLVKTPPNKKKSVPAHNMFSIRATMTALPRRHGVRGRCNTEDGKREFPQFGLGWFSVIRQLHLRVCAPSLENFPEVHAAPKAHSALKCNAQETNRELKQLGVGGRGLSNVPMLCLLSFEHSCSS